MQITPNFSLDEVTFSSTATRLGIDNRIPDHLVPNVRAQAIGMELVRKRLGAPLHVDSWYRCPALNIADHGAQHSAHMDALATDFTCHTYGTPKEVIRAIMDSDIQFDKLIYEGTWVHISFAPAARRIILTAVFNPGKPTTYTEGIT